MGLPFGLGAFAGWADDRTAPAFRKEVTVPFEEKILTCQGCGAEFVFSAEEQEFFANRSYSEPKRCPSCRAARRSERAAGGSSVRTRVMYPATCAACGKETQVPFEPKEGRPVYCRDCYMMRGSDNSRPQLQA
jgi:CxxC-x17-CxxC domain-containing protein